MLQQSTLAAAKRVVRRMEPGLSQRARPHFAKRSTWGWGGSNELPAPSSFLFLVRPGDPSSVLAPRLEVHDPAALVACCQQLVECSVGIRPEARSDGTEIEWRERDFGRIVIRLI